MKTKIERAIKDLAEKAGDTNVSSDALKFSQAATNLANALYVIDDNSRQAKFAGNEK